MHDTVLIENIEGVGGSHKMNRIIEWMMDHPKTSIAIGLIMLAISEAIKISVYMRLVS